MTEQEILDCNKAIAEFMGIKSTWIYCFVCDSMYQEAGCAYAACGSKTEERNRHMDYQDNWSELMPVVEKIKDTVLSFDIYMQGAYTKVIC